MCRLTLILILEFYFHFLYFPFTNPSLGLIINGMDNYNFDIQEELKKLPASPGVYIMHDEKDNIIYVGKAISLKNRVRQYFQSSRNKGVKIEQMVTHIRRFEYIVTDSELEALVLECNLIKEHRPKYNTMLMDDKTYPFIKVTTNEPFPRAVSYTHLMDVLVYKGCGKEN